jgi:hypothetical protein
VDPSPPIHNEKETDWRRNGVNRYGSEEVTETIISLIFQINAHFLFPVALRPNAGHGLLILEVYRSHTTTHHSR